MRCSCLNKSSCGSSRELMCGTPQHMFSPKHQTSSAEIELSLENGEHFMLNRAVAQAVCQFVKLVFASAGSTLVRESSCGKGGVAIC